MLAKRFTRSAAMMLCLTFAGAGTARAEVALGASFGYTHRSYASEYARGLKNDVFGIPGTQEWYQPGLRVGYVAPDRRWDLNADVGLVHWSSNLGGGIHGTTVELLPQVQVNAHGPGAFSAFVNGSVGLVHETVPSSSTNSVTATRPVFGAGVGVRKAVSDGHGLVRVELRYDHLPESVKVLSPTATFILPATNMFSVKLGFDLLVAR